MYSQESTVTVIGEEGRRASGHETRESKLRMHERARHECEKERGEQTVQAPPCVNVSWVQIVHSLVVRVNRPGAHQLAPVSAHCRCARTLRVRCSAHLISQD